MLLDKNFILFKPYLKDGLIELPLETWDNKQVGILRINPISKKKETVLFNENRGWFFLGNKTIINKIIFVNNVIDFSEHFNINVNPLSTLYMFTHSTILQQDVDMLKGFKDCHISTFIRPKSARLLFICKYHNYSLKFANNGYIINNKFIPFEYSLTDLNYLQNHRKQKIKHL